jgi:hypothetical protein
MNPLYELNRYRFVESRDGVDAAKAFARRCIKIYLGSLKSKRARYGRHFDLRREHLEGAYSFRFILRHAV